MIIFHTLHCTCTLSLSGDSDSEEEGGGGGGPMVVRPIVINRVVAPAPVREPMSKIKWKTTIRHKWNANAKASQQAAFRYKTQTG